MRAILRYFFIVGCLGFGYGTSYHPWDYIAVVVGCVFLVWKLNQLTDAERIVRRWQIFELALPETAKQVREADERVNG